MYFYHENYHASYYDAYGTDADLEDLRLCDRRGDDRTFEPIRIPAILHWLVIVSVALCVTSAAIFGLS
jgi:hypothetical protein